MEVEDIRALEPEILRNKYPESKRKDMDESDFCGPDRSFPIKDAEDVTHAAMLLHNATGSQSAIKKCVIGKAKAHGWPLPETWKEEDGKERMDTPDVTRADDDIEHHSVPVIVRADGSHAPFKGSHSHSHPAFGSQGDDENHSHEHPHNGDADHNHPEVHGDRADEPDILRNQPAEFSFFAPIVRVDPAKREVTVRATSEALDTYGTVFDFEGSKDAFSRWYGNIREMHAHKAVGHGLEWIARNGEKAIDTVLHVSTGAQDTWAKILDGTLMGASIGAKNGVWGKRTIDGKEVPVLLRYDLVELSLVDNPSNPDATIQIIRMAGDGLEATDVLEEVEQPEEERVGKPISAANASKSHAGAMHALQAAKSAADLCGCDACKEVSMALDPDQDGDIDIGDSSLDTDNDDGSVNKQMLADGSVAMIMKSAIADITRAAKETADVQLTSTLRRMNAIAARLSQIDQPDLADITRRLDEVSGLRTELAELRSAMVEVKGITESYANRAQSGGPVVNTGNMRGAPPAPLAPQQLAAHYAPFVELLIKQGIIRDREQQIQANLLVQQLANGG